MDTQNQDIWENLALSSIGGLVSSTVLLLLVMPALYYLSIRVKWLGMRLRDWILRRRPEPLGEPGTAGV